ncbi:hypothetical protein CHARACLAT_003480 [Characodon lateralis]|uniref:Secreted protein n=1 Tax=Characodon lateralis TaxID=208331 RepID=A0ABU7EG27_9TELE|nr:hypothetical protein [Characodon lateralis]
MLFFPLLLCTLVVLLFSLLFCHPVLLPGNEGIDLLSNPASKQRQLLFTSFLCRINRGSAKLSFQAGTCHSVTLHQSSELFSQYR